MKNDNLNCYLDVKRLRGKRLQQYNYIAKKISNFDILNYKSQLWMEESIIKQNRYVWKRNINYKKSNWFKFQESIKDHHTFVMSNLKLG
jgi:hypothetical protein